MSRADGFHPMRQSSGQPLGARPESMDYLEEPIVLDHQDEPATSKKRRKLLGKQKKHHSRRRRAAKKLLTVIAILIVAGLGAMAYKFYDTQRNILAGGGRAPAICNGEVPVDQLKREGDGRVNVLLVGIGGAEQPRGPDLTDTLIIASIDPVTNKAELLSIPRDLWVRIPGNGARKINEAYFHGIEESSAQSLEQQQRDGLALLEKTVQNLAGGPGLVRLGERVLHLAENLRFAEDHGIQAGGDAEHVPHGRLLGIDIEIRQQLFDAQPVIAAQPLDHVARQFRVQAAVDLGAVARRQDRRCVYIGQKREFVQGLGQSLRRERHALTDVHRRSAMINAEGDQRHVRAGGC